MAKKINTANIKYYPARLAESYDTPVEALMSVGFRADRADQLIDEAAMNRSDAVVVMFDEYDGIPITAAADGRHQLCDSEDEAWAYAMEIQAGLPRTQ
jgi:hypothetical protein